MIKLLWPASESLRYTLTGSVIFFYALFIGLGIQLVLIPVFFPHFDLGDGMVVLDSSGFNQMAKSKAAELVSQGWGAWQFRPGAQLQSPAGIASVFYALITPKPYSVLPLNALVHAASGCFVLWLLRLCFPWKAALFGVVLFVVNPASLEWVAQIHRDGLFILGNLMSLVALILFLIGLKKGEIRPIVFGFVFGVLGAGITSIAREYWVQVLNVSAFLTIPLMVWAYLASPRTTNFRVLLAFFMLFFGVVFGQFQLSKHLQADYGGASHYERAVQRFGDTKSVEKSNRPPQAASSVWDSWSVTDGLPPWIDHKLFLMHQRRLGAINAGGNTLIDRDNLLVSAPEFLWYFPRALQLGLFSPFPEFWSGKASTPAMTTARKLMGGVTIMFYVCLIGLAFGLYRYRNKPEVWLIFGFCLLGILLYVYSYPNVGTLMRYRYGFYMLLVSFGAATLISIRSQWPNSGCHT